MEQEWPVLAGAAVNTCAGERRELLDSRLRIWQSSRTLTGNECSSRQG